MGFLKFLKRQKKEKDFEDLDLPPEPPSLGDEAELGAYSGFDEKSQELDFPELKEEDISAGLPKFDFPEMEDKMPELKEENAELSSLPEMEEEPMPPIPPVSAPEAAPMPSMPEQMPEEQEMKTHEETKPAEHYPRARLFSHEKRIAREKPSVKIIYVKVENFKAILGSINVVRSDLRSSEESLIKLENLKSSKDKSFDKIKSSLDDLQKKLIFVDKTLFKGELK